MKIKVYVYLVFICIAGFFGHCAHMAPRPALGINEERLEVIKEALFRNFYHIKTFKGYGTLNVLTPVESFKADIEALIVNPDSVYVKLEATLGIDVGMLFASREGYLLYSPRQNTFYRDDSAVLDLQSFIGMKLTFGNLLETLLGLELLDGLNEATVSAVPSEAEITVSGMVGNFEAIYTIDPAKGVVKNTRIYDTDNRLILAAKYSRFIYSRGSYMPKTIQIIKPITKESITLFYTFVKLNESIKHEQFRIKIPDNAIREEL
ncbi:DUF4292 domain-containing protein [candidate division KSB1 bacterium]|nr:DUF4292 domain-containing protein [candidate division KSB1 bacterium]